MDFSTSSLDSQTCERLINSLTVPRPIAWVTSESAIGVRNLAPFSYYNIVSYRPPVTMISFSGLKHSWANILAIKEYVINVVSADLAATMVASSYEYEEDVDEAVALGLPLAASHVVKVPRLAGARAAFECRFHSTLEIGTGKIVFGTIEHIVVSDQVLKNGRILTDLLQPVGRLGGSEYCIAKPDMNLKKPTAPVLATDPKL